mgnify:FL=1|jgi:hypothetical protein
MKRNYTDGIKEDVVFFIGKEVEHTPAYGMNTLFVTGVQPVDEIASKLNGCNHIFFGANHSFNPSINDYNGWKAWEDMIQFFLDKDYLCSLDIPISAVEEFNDGGLNDHSNFIPQIRVPIPYVKLWNYNTMLKIDDKDFKATNPGVWSHSLHTLMDRSKFTDWNQYKQDKIL